MLKRTPLGERAPLPKRIHVFTFADVMDALLPILHAVDPATADRVCSVHLTSFNNHAVLIIGYELGGTHPITRRPRVTTKTVWLT
jgi:hypothetical protein